MTWNILQGDALAVLKTLPDESVQTCVTSPPYWGLRDYGTVGQLGLERTPDEYIAKMVEVFREVRRVLRSDGTLWMNMGDSYAAAASGRTHPNDAARPKQDGAYTVPSLACREARWEPKNYPGRAPEGLKPKDLCGIPWMLAFALRADGWWLRSDIIWAKPNPMPESVTDRPTKAHEYIFLLTKSERYFYDAEAIREPHADTCVVDGQYRNGRSGGVNRADYEPETQGFNGGGIKMVDRQYNPAGRNKRTVWSIATAPFPEAHFATFPPEIPEICIKAGTSESLHRARSIQRRGHNRLSRHPLPSQLRRH